MKKIIFLFCLFLSLAYSAAAQVRPDQFAKESTLRGKNLASYSQEGGVLRGFKVDSILAQGFGIYEPVVTYVPKTGNAIDTRNKIVTDYKGRVYAIDFHGNSKILIDTLAYATTTALASSDAATRAYALQQVLQGVNTAVSNANDYTDSKTAKAVTAGAGVSVDSSTGKYIVSATATPVTVSGGSQTIDVNGTSIDINEIHVQDSISVPKHNPNVEGGWSVVLEKPTGKLHVWDASGGVWKTLEDQTASVAAINASIAATNTAVNLKASKTALSDTAASLYSRLNADTWKLQGNDFFANNAYKVGIKSGVDLTQSTSPYYYAAKNMLHIGLNTDNADNFSSTIQKAIFTIRPDELFTICQSPKGYLEQRFNSNSVLFKVIRENETYVRQFQTTFNNGAAAISISTKKGVLNTTYKTTIFTSDSTIIYPNLTTSFSTTSNGDLLLDQNTARAYIFKDGKVQKVAYTTEVILKATTVPTSTADTSGNVGDEISDDNFKYVKTSVGWKRYALSTF